MGPHLHVTLPDGASRDLVLDRDAGSAGFTLGRLPDNSFCLSEGSASKRHAAVRFQDGRWVVCDLGSSNGTYVNGDAVTVHPLRHGDEIRIGETVLCFVDPAAATLIQTEAGGDGTQTIVAHLAHDVGFLPVDVIRDQGQLRRDYEKLRIAAEFSRAVGLERDIDVLLERILDFAFGTLPADCGAILLVDEATGEMSPRVVVNRSARASTDTETTAGDWHVSRSVLERVRTRSESVLIWDAEGEDDWQNVRSLQMEGVQSAMAVPLTIQDTVTGVLFLDNRSAKGAFGERDLQILSGIAVQASLALERTSLARKFEAEAKRRAHLHRFLSPALVRQVEKGELSLEPGGTSREVTVLFSDIRGFTALSERMGPQGTVAMLNEYFGAMVDMVFEHGGVLDKFIGDAILAMWGAPVAQPDDAARALACAGAMQRRLAGLNEQRVARGDDAIGAGIGLNTGEAVVGNIGSPRRLEYTVIGDAVNVASRLCGQAEAGAVLVAKATVDRAQSDLALEPLDPIRVKGKTEPIELYGLAP